MKSVRKNGAAISMVMGGLAASVIVAAIAALCLGSQPYTLGQLWQALCTQGEQDPVWRVIAYVRLPRMLGGLFSGAALAVAGVLLQAVLNNAMASPNVIGVNAGSGFCALLAMVLVPTVPGAMQFAAFLGALGCSMLVYLLAWRAGISRTTLVLAGLAVSGMLTAGINTLKLLWPEIVASSPGFLTGGLSGVTMSMLGAAFPYFVVGLLLALFLTVVVSGRRKRSRAGPACDANPFSGHSGSSVAGGGCGKLCWFVEFCGVARTTHCAQTGGYRPSDSGAGIGLIGSCVCDRVRHSCATFVCSV